MSGTAPVAGQCSASMVHPCNIRSPIVLHHASSSSRRLGRSGSDVAGGSTPSCAPAHPTGGADKLAPVAAPKCAAVLCICPTFVGVSSVDSTAIGAASASVEPSSSVYLPTATLNFRWLTGCCIRGTAPVTGHAWSIILQPWRRSSPISLLIRFATVPVSRPPLMLVPVHSLLCLLICYPS